MVSRLFLGGLLDGFLVFLVSRWCLGGFLVVSWMVSWWFLGGDRPCLGGFLVVSWWFLGGFLDGFLVVSWLFPNSKRLGLLTLKAVRRHRVPGR